MGHDQSGRRADFSERTKRTLALRSAFRCSNPGCGALTIGPGTAATDVELTGTASHIYAAAPNGPRGTGGLSHSQRSDALNAIWLCAQCARLVDTNAGNAYPASLLRGWRDLHETRIRMEHGGTSRPFGWIHSIEIHDDVWLREPTTVRFSRCNMILGANGVGKTHFLSLLSALASPSTIMERVSRPNSRVHASINWYDPQPRCAEFRAEGDQLRFSADGVEVPFVSQPYRIIHLPHDRWHHVPRRLDDLAATVGLDEWAARKLVLSVPEIVRGAVKRVWIQEDRLRAEYVSGSQVIKDQGSHHSLRSTVGLEVLVALAETYARTQPTLLLVDGLHSGVYPDFRHSSELLSSPARGFQTVATSTRSDISLDPEWTVSRITHDSDFPNLERRWARVVQDEPDI